VEVNGRRGWWGISAGIYKKRWKDPPFFSWENPLFLAIFNGKIHYFMGKYFFHGKIHYFYGHGFNSKLLNYQRLDIFLGLEVMIHGGFPGNAKFPVVTIGFKWFQYWNG
jgi:hypothetical protein